MDDTLPQEVAQPDNLPNPTPIKPEPLTSKTTVHQFWHQFTIWKAVEFLVSSWGDIHQATINHTWCTLVSYQIPQTVNEHEQWIAKLQWVVQAVAHVVAGCENVTEDELKELKPEETIEAAILYADMEDELTRDHKDKCKRNRS